MDNLNNTGTFTGKAGGRLSGSITPKLRDIALGTPPGGRDVVRVTVLLLLGDVGRIKINEGSGAGDKAHGDAAT